MSKCYIWVRENVQMYAKFYSSIYSTVFVYPAPLQNPSLFVGKFCSANNTTAPAADKWGVRESASEAGLGIHYFALRSKSLPYIFAQSLFFKEQQEQFALVFLDKRAIVS